MKKKNVSIKNRRKRNEKTNYFNYDIFVHVLWKKK